MRRSSLLIAGLITLLNLPAFADDRAPLFPSSSSDDFPVFGLRLTPPDGWTRENIPGGPWVARWLKQNAQKKTQAILQVSYAPNKQTLDQQSRYFVQDLHASSLHTMRVAGNIDALYAQGNFGTSVQSVPAIFAVSKDKTSFVTLLIRPNNATPPEDDAIMQSFISNWDWIDIQEPFQHLDLTPKPVAVLNNKFTVKLPLISAPAKSDKPDTKLIYTITNIKTQTLEFQITLLVSPIIHDQVQLQNRIVENVYKLKTHPEWITLPGDGSMTKWITTDRFSKDTYTSIGSVRLDADLCVLFEAHLLRTEPHIQNAYFDTLQKLVQSITPGTDLKKK